MTVVYAWMELQSEMQRICTLQVPDEYQRDQYLYGLDRLREEQATVCNKQLLSEQQMDCVVQVATGLAEVWRSDRETGRDAPSIPVYLPDAEGMMANVLHLKVNDADWLAKDQRLLHPQIHYKIGRQLGVTSLRLHHQVIEGC